MLVEKAYAKLYKSYAAIKDGEVSDAFRDLTGAPCFKLENSKPEDYWQFFLDCKKKSFF